MAAGKGAEAGAGWGSRLGFILATAGAAVGLGNIWKFPYMAGENGGGAFVLFYLFCAVILGVPIMVSELLIGRRSQMDPVGAFKSLAHGNPFWQLVGYMALLSAILVLAYYSIVCGWTLYYTYTAGTNGFSNQALVEKGGDYIWNDINPNTIIYTEYEDEPTQHLFTGPNADAFAQYLEARYESIVAPKDEKALQEAGQFFQDKNVPIAKQIFSADYKALLFYGPLYPKIAELAKAHPEGLRPETIAKVAGALHLRPEGLSGEVRTQVEEVHQGLVNTTGLGKSYNGEIVKVPAVNPYELSLPEHQLLPLFKFLETVAMNSPDLSFPEYVRGPTEKTFQRVMLALESSPTLLPTIIKRYADRIQETGINAGSPDAQAETQVRYLQELAAAVSALARVEAMGTEDRERALSIGKVGEFLKEERQARGLPMAGEQDEGVIALRQGIKQAGSQGLFGTLRDNVWLQIILHLVFMLANFLVVSLGVQAGIEKAAKFLMPALFALLIGLLFYVIFATDILLALEYMFFRPDFNKLMDGEVLVKALGQAFFSLSIGIGTILAYGSYLSRKTRILSSAGIVVTLDTGIALVAGIIIFSLVFSFGGNTDEGVSLVFLNLPILFADMPGGFFIAIAFFVLLVFAAFTSSISILEVPVTYFVRQWGWPRWQASLFAASALTIIGALCATTFFVGPYSIFDWFDNLTAVITMPLCGLLIALFVGWRMSEAQRQEEFDMKGGEGRVYPIYRFLLQTVTIILASIVMIYGVYNMIVNLATRL